MLLAIAGVLAAGGASAAESSISRGHSHQVRPHTATPEHLSQGNRQTEQNAFFASEYTYWDAAQLAEYWGQSLGEAKARIGRKVLWGQTDVAILEQMLLDARLASLQSLEETETLRFYLESDYSYDDAAALADFWGDATPYEAKLRIERNLILGHADGVEAALQLATR